MTPDPSTYPRAVAAALLGLAFQFLATAALALLGLWTGQPGALAAAWCAGAGLLPWVCAALVFQQHRLERLEALETERLRAGPDSSLFEQAADELAVARRRLERLYRWVLPLTALASALYLLAAGGWLFHRQLPGFRAPADFPALAEPLLALAGAAATAFLSFVASRYLAGMARTPEWQLLRGGAGFLMGAALCALAFAAGAALAHFEYHWPRRALAFVLPVLMALLGLEMLLNLVLNLYRPRRAGEFPRPAFDSRLLGLLTSPESLAQTIQEAINYQFGFQLTQSWFWKLLERACLPLAAFAVAILLLLSCVVVVGPSERAVRVRGGRILAQGPEEVRRRRAKAKASMEYRW
jgi:hypothetical protein